jgi:hypothetical protein
VECGRPRAGTSTHHHDAFKCLSRPERRLPLPQALVLREVLCPPHSHSSPPAWVCWDCSAGAGSESRNGRMIDQSVGVDFGEAAARRSFCLCENVRYWHKADIAFCTAHVRL